MPTLGGLQKNQLLKSGMDGGGSQRAHPSQLNYFCLLLIQGEAESLMTPPGSDGQFQHSGHSDGSSYTEWLKVMNLRLSCASQVLGLKPKVVNLRL